MLLLPKDKMIQPGKEPGGKSPGFGDASRDVLGAQKLSMGSTGWEETPGQDTAPREQGEARNKQPRAGAKYVAGSGELGGQGEHHNWAHSGGKHRAYRLHMPLRGSRTPQLQPQGSGHPTKPPTVPRRRTPPSTRDSGSPVLCSFPGLPGTPRPGVSGSKEAAALTHASPPEPRRVAPICLRHHPRGPGPRHAWV